MIELLIRNLEMMLGIHRSLKLVDVLMFCLEVVLRDMVNDRLMVDISLSLCLKIAFLWLIII